MIAFWRWFVGDEAITRQAAIKQVLLTYASEDRRRILHPASDPKKVQLSEWAQHTARLRAKHKKRA